MVYPYFYLNYQKKDAQTFLEKEYGWEYYGGHHHENLFTKFSIANWMPNKFGIDKRLVTLSAQVLSGEISREDALDQISKPPCDKSQMEFDKQFVIKKLGLNELEFEEIWARPNKSFQDYPSYLPLIEKLSNILKPLIGFVLPQKPAYFVQKEIRENN